MFAERRRRRWGKDEEDAETERGVEEEGVKCKDPTEFDHNGWDRNNYECKAGMQTQKS